MDAEKLERISDFIYELPQGAKRGMRVPARIYADLRLIASMDNAVLDQIATVAMLPGIQRHAVCMPDGHSGYGFPIGGVAAIDPDDGVISPGGIGFDINCGIRLVRTSLGLEELKPRLKNLVDSLYARIPSGVGSGGVVSLGHGQMDAAMTRGARWAVENGHGLAEDLECIEENGCVPGADPAAVSKKARERGREQVGSLGSGNHFLEIQCARRENIYDERGARILGIDRDDQIFIMIHSGSRGFGHQIATDYLQRFLAVMGPRYGLSMPDRELACAPFHSDDGQAYFAAMNCAINIAFLNRQLMMHRVRETLCDVFRKTPAELGISLVYDVCHNTAKLEEHRIDGKPKRLLVHRKGATRAFAAGMRGVPEKYAELGQPVIIGGSMETGSYLCAGLHGAKESFYSTVHGSGRVMSRSQAKKRFNGRQLQADMEARGIYIRAASLSGLAEEAGAAYKNIDEVVGAAHHAGLSRPIARLVPLGNIKA